MFANNPTPARQATRDDPPWLMKGKVIPVYGAMAVFTAMLISAWSTNQDVNPAASNMA